MAFNHEQKCQLKGEMAELGPFSEAKRRPFRGRTGIYRSVSGNSAPRQRRGGNAGTATLGRQRQHVKRRLRGASLPDSIESARMLRNRSAAALVETQPARRATSWHRANRGRPADTRGHSPASAERPPLLPTRQGTGGGAGAAAASHASVGPGRSSSATSSASRAMESRLQGRRRDGTGSLGERPAPHRPRTRSTSTTDPLVQRALEDLLGERILQHALDGTTQRARAEGGVSALFGDEAAWPASSRLMVMFWAIMTLAQLGHHEVDDLHDLVLGERS